MSFMIAAIFLTNVEPTDWLSNSCWAADAAAADEEDNELVDPEDGLRDGAATERFDVVTDGRRVGSMRLQLFGTLTAHRLW